MEERNKTLNFSVATERNGEETNSVNEVNLEETMGEETMEKPKPRPEETNTDLVTTDATTTTNFVREVWVEQTLEKAFRILITKYNFLCFLTCILTFYSF